MNVPARDVSCTAAFGDLPTSRSGLGAIAAAAAQPQNIAQPPARQNAAPDFEPADFRQPPQRDPPVYAGPAAHMLPAAVAVARDVHQRQAALAQFRLAGDQRAGP